MKIALATCDPLPAPDRDAEVLVPLLESRGVVAETPVWSDPGVDWAGYDRVMINTTWDYHDRLEEFRAWLRRLTAAGVRLDNPIELVEWNLDKRYLRELSAAGVPVIPTVWGSGPGEAERSADEVARRGWDRVVVKPSVDLGALNLVRTDASEVAGAAAGISRTHLVQPYLPSLEEEGELSVVYLAGEMSHAVVKSPVPGDFRVQPQYGATERPIEPDADALDVATRTMDAIDSDGSPLYGRVDLVRDLEGRWCCIELELIEPALFLGVSEGASERLTELLTAGA